MHPPPPPQKKKNGKKKTKRKKKNETQIDIRFGNINHYPYKYNT